MPRSRIMKLNDFEQAPMTFDNIGANTGHKSDSLKKTIQLRHVLDDCVSTGIGTGLLVGNGTALVHAVQLDYLLVTLIMGSILYCIIQACG
ncbi:ATV_HP_G0103510.mRNA.1.CDS.1 [Saccharomyces cerevisiae]|nr:ATV_HP_G0103510.mRNA.1.CDS.1 [Saccharomyces cerevisiae]CAI6618402.1 ATV_HP_G0103510.mRNA.1.CDS.1 [Saccharomyces cerevisiae]